MRIRNTRTLLMALAMTGFARTALAQPCLIDYTLTANPPPVGGQFSSGQQVVFCYTINTWDPVLANNNWLHGVVPSFGAGWDAASFIAGAPPFECGGMGGSWQYFNSVTGTGPFNVGTVGPGWFFDLDNDGDPGNNLGDDCTGPWTFCIVLTVPSGVNCVDGADLSVTFDTFGDSETGSWTDTGCGGDAASTFNATAVCCNANAGTNGAISVCFSDPPFDMFPLLGNNPDPGGTWTDLFGQPVTSIIDPSVAISGDYTYSVGPPGCPPAQSIVSVSINYGVNAGVDAAASVCDQDGVVDLSGFLGPNDVGGSWTGPGGPSTGFFDPLIDTPGAYTYTLAAVGNCPGDDATVTVAVVPGPSPGTSALIDACAGSAPVDLFPALGAADAGGSWTAPGGGANNGFFDPLIDVPGTYTYSVVGNAPCLPAQATVDVNLVNPPQNGTVVAAIFCSTDAPADLFPLFNGLADAGGTWTDPNGAPFTGILDPGSDISGLYDYTVAGTAPCPDGVNSVDVTIIPTPDPGFPGGLTTCAAGAPVDLFLSLLGTPDAGGTWTDPNGGAFSGTLDPTTALPGTYTYTVPANGQCPGGSTTVDVAVVQPANAGTDNSIALCENAPNSDLDLQLGGAQDVNGAWTGPGGGASNGIVDPTLLDAGDYTYTVQGNAPCPDDVAIVTVVIDTLPSPGGDNAISPCANLAPIDLFTLLGVADTVGTWTNPGGGPFSGVYDPATNIDGDYTYTVNGTGACTGQSFSAVISATSLVVPSPVFTQDTTQGCVLLDISFLLGDPTITLSEWSFGDGATSNGVLDAAHTYEDAGYYDVTVIVTDNNGCTDTLTVDSGVVAHALPDPFFISEPNPATTLSPYVHFTTAVNDYPSYVWTVEGDSTGTGTPFDIHFPYFEVQTSEVCLTVIDTNQCTAEHCEEVVVQQDLALYVPNAFSPNGNGINEFFYPVILGAEATDYEFSIFDRWGELVFNTTEMYDPWNGGMNNGGEILEPGVFTWRVRLRESAKAEREDIYGHVTLLK